MPAITVHFSLTVTLLLQLLPCNTVNKTECSYALCCSAQQCFGEQHGLASLGSNPIAVVTIMPTQVALFVCYNNLQVSVRPCDCERRG